MGVLMVLMSTFITNLYLVYVSATVSIFLCPITDIIYEVLFYYFAKIYPVENLVILEQ